MHLIIDLLSARDPLPSFKRPLVFKAFFPSIFDPKTHYTELFPMIVTEIEPKQNHCLKINDLRHFSFHSPCETFATTLDKHIG